MKESRGDDWEKDVQNGELARSLDRIDGEEGKQREAQDEQGEGGEVEAAEDEQAIPSTYCRHPLANDARRNGCWVV